jgi:hypothetical protein
MPQESLSTNIMKIRFPNLGVMLILLLSGVAQRVEAAFDAEPQNNVHTTAPTLALGWGFTQGFGTLWSSGDHRDWYKFTPGSSIKRVWIYVNTGWATATANSSVPPGHAQVYLYNASTNLIEADSFDGAQTANSPSIGSRLVPAGQYSYIKVEARAWNGDFYVPRDLNSYQLNVVVVGGLSAPPSEDLSNNTPAEADNMIASSVPATYAVERSGSFSSFSDVDYYSVGALKDSVLYISADCDPDKDLNGTDLRLELIAPDTSTVLFTANSSGQTSLGPGGVGKTPVSEAFTYKVPTMGLYYVRVTKVIASQYNNYFLMVARKDPPVFIGPLFDAGNLHLRWQGHEGDNYQVEGTTDMRGWARVSDIIPGADGIQSFVDLGAGRRPMRLYRLVTLP